MFGKNTDYYQLSLLHFARCSCDFGAISNEGSILVFIDIDNAIILRSSADVKKQINKRKSNLYE